MKSVLDSLAPLAVAMAYLPMLILLWLAVFFGRTLRAGAVPLIERIARVGKPDLSPDLCRYTRRLTVLWTGYFVAAAMLLLAANLALFQAGAGVATVSAVFFVGEIRVRQRLYPQEWFPGLVQQIRDTVSVWRPRRDA